MRTRLTPMISGVLFAALAAGAFAAEFGAQRSSAGGVTITVTPQSLAADAKSWDFKVVLDTHSQDLGDDLVQSAVLLDGTGGRHIPSSWEGAGPGGHHREGVLRFNPGSPRSQAIELHIQRQGESAVRVFRWQLK